MNRSAVLALLGAALMALSACATTPPATPPPPTATPTVAIEPLPCPEGYEGYASGKMAFSACYPSGWQASEFDDPENNVLGVEITAPGADAQPVPTTIRVSNGPLDPDVSPDKALEGFAIEFMNRRSVQGRPVVPIAAMRIGEINAAQDTLEGSVMDGTQRFEYTGWVAGFAAQGRKWYITVTGPSEQQMEIEEIYHNFLEGFQLLS